MECRGIQEKLSPYLEGMLSEADKAAVKEHLASCGACRTVLEELRKAGEVLGRLDRVEPPPWLATRIMGQIGEEVGHRRGVASWLFRPLRVKIPLQAFAVLVVVGLAVLVYRENVTRFEPSKATAPSKESVVTATGRVPPPALTTSRESESQGSGPASRAAPEKQKAQKVAPARVQRTPREALSTAEAPKAAEEKAVAAPSSQTETAKGLAPPGPSGTMKEQARADAIGGGEESHKARALRAAAPAVTGKAEGRGFDTIVLTEDAKGTAAQIESLLRVVEARSIVTETRSGELAVSAEVRNERVPQLADMLKRYAASPLPSALAEGTGSSLVITIHVVGP